MESVLKVYVIVFENSKDVCFEIEQATKINLPTQKVLGVLFPPSFRRCYLIIVLVRSSIVGCEGTSVGSSYDHDINVVR